ncbi:phosphoglycerate kinase [Hyphobacterium sp. CCMP332]|nr:phosphoglycerate kinase [Hyphobacterium sp. CCMP332]
MKTIDDISFSGKKVLMRVDFNVPLDSNQKVSDETRINSAIPSIKKILNEGGAVILMSHLGRPKQGPEAKFSLKHIIPNLNKALGLEVQFADDCIGKSAKELSEKLNSGEVLLLENVRFYKEETKGDTNFAKQLASLGDAYVNDAFGTAHRAHASTTTIAEFFEEKAAGYLIQAEIENAKKVLEHTERPFVAIMGGAKISDKILIIEKLLDKVDYLIIGGGMSYTFINAQGGKIGNSLCEEDKIPLAKELIGKSKDKGVSILLPMDSVAADAFDNDANTMICNSHEIKDGYMGLDIGPQAIKTYSETISSAKTILWNGPMGVFEMDNFSKGTKEIAKAIAAASAKGAFSLIGGGDSAAAVNQLGYGDKVSFVSTGGGALLEYFEGKELPGILALDQ